MPTIFKEEFLVNTLAMLLILLPVIFLGSNIADPTKQALISNDSLRIDKSFLIDPTGKLSVEEIRNKTLQKNTQEKIPWSFKQQTYWIKTTIINRTKTSQALILHYDNPMLNSLSIYQFQDDTLQRDHELSWQNAQLSLIQRSIFSHSFSIAGNSTIDIYSAIYTRGIAKTPINIYTPQDFSALKRSTYLIWGAFIGILSMIAMYNLVLYFGLKERIFLTYIGYILSTLTMMSIVQGFGHYLFPTFVFHFLRINVISLNYLVLIFAVLFALYFLNYHQTREKIYQKSIYYVYLLITLCLISIALGENLAAPIFFIAMTIAYPLCFILLYKRYKSSQFWSVLYSVSWIPLLIGGAIQPLELTDVIPYSFIARHTFSICILFEITLMAMALSQRLRQQKEISLYNATHDLETGLPNYNKLEECLQTRALDKQPLILCLISVVGLSRLSPYLNNHQNMTILSHFLSVIRNHINHSPHFLILDKGDKKEIKIARIRDNVFAILLTPHQNKNTIFEQIQPLSHVINNKLKLSGVSVNLKANFGFYQTNDQHYSASVLLKKSFQALETGMREGLIICAYDDKKHYSLTLANDLRDALLNNELMLYHQPQINLKSATVHGSEGLLRWKHKEQGFIAVESFIALAEETGLINRITFWVIDQACQDICALEDRGYNQHHVSVNISGSDAMHPDFLNNVENIINKRRVRANKLTLELTESVMISDYNSLEYVIRGLSQLGVCVSIDDFGTGYSSLSHILQLPFSELKIDRIFVTQMNTNQRNFDIVKTTIEMAKILDLRVVAEGIETQSVAEKLLNCHCDLAQGYHYSKPIHFSDYLNWLDQYNTN
jgi:EAL domain-containing protein (putative c-di-GMP-specific phosphodiesterase class I)/GGDEF domain-containing protein